MKFQRLVLVFVLLLWACGPTPEGGVNENEEGAGNREGGIALRTGAIGLSPDGRSYVVLLNGQLALGDLVTEEASVIEDIPSPDLLAFSTDARPRFYVTSDEITHDEEKDRYLHVAAVHAYDSAEGRVLWTRALDKPGIRLDVSPDGRRLLIKSLDFDGETHAHAIRSIDADSGEVTAVLKADAPSDTFNDVDHLPDGRVVLTSRAWQKDDTPQVTLEVYSPDLSERLCSVDVPNCSSSLTLVPGGQRGFLAPTLCAVDPVSVVDFADGCTFVTNLPGFGPVGYLRDGAIAVAFLDRLSTDPNAPPMPQEVLDDPLRYHLMLIDTGTLEFETVPWGNTLPRFAASPSGEQLVVDSSLKASARVFDFESRTFRSIDGPGVVLDHYGFAVDGLRMYLNLSGLMELDLLNATSRGLRTPFHPSRLNVLPDDDRILLRESKDTLPVLYDPVTETVVVLATNDS